MPVKKTQKTSRKTEAVDKTISEVKRKEPVKDIPKDKEKTASEPKMAPPQAEEKHCGVFRTETEFFGG
jgi:hypothetical protein